jgi:hypothetical protein
LRGAGIAVKVELKNDNRHSRRKRGPKRAL